VCAGELVASVPREPIWRVLNLLRGTYWRHTGNTTRAPAALGAALLP
jgi:hypothetical protein